MKTVGKRVAGYGAALAAGIAFGSGVPTDLSLGSPEVPPRCLTVDDTQNTYESFTPGGERMNRLGGALVSYIADRCINPGRGEHAGMYHMGGAAMQLIVRRTIPGDAQTGLGGGTYDLRVTTAKTPKGELSPVSVTDVYVMVNANAPTESDPRAQVNTYGLNGAYEKGQWDIQVWGQGGEYPVPPAEDGIVRDEDIWMIDSAVADVMAGENTCRPIYPSAG